MFAERVTDTRGPEMAIAYPTEDGDGVWVRSYWGISQAWSTPVSITTGLIDGALYSEVKDIELVAVDMFWVVSWQVDFYDTAGAYMQTQTMVRSVHTNTGILSRYPTDVHNFLRSGAITAWQTVLNVYPVDPSTSYDYYVLFTNEDNTLQLNEWISNDNVWGEEVVLAEASTSDPVVVRGTGVYENSFYVLSDDNGIALERVEAASGSTIADFDVSLTSDEEAVLLDADLGKDNVLHVLYSIGEKVYWTPGTGWQKKRGGYKSFTSAARPLPTVRMYTNGRIELIMKKAKPMRKVTYNSKKKTWSKAKPLKRTYGDYRLQGLTSREYVTNPSGKLSVDLFRNNKLNSFYLKQWKVGGDITDAATLTFPGKYRLLHHARTGSYMFTVIRKGEKLKSYIGWYPNMLVK